MSNNPYLELYDLMGKATVIKPYFFIAKVTNSLPDLKISLEGIELDKDDFIISKQLLITNNANIDCTNETVSHNLKDLLSIGDRVLVVKVNDLFIILDKVVNI